MRLFDPFGFVVVLSLSCQRFSFYQIRHHFHCFLSCQIMSENPVRPTLLERMGGLPISTPPSELMKSLSGIEDLSSPKQQPSLPSNLHSLLERLKSPPISLSSLSPVTYIDLLDRIDKSWEESHGNDEPERTCWEAKSDIVPGRGNCEWPSIPFVCSGGSSQQFSAPMSLMKKKMRHVSEDGLVSMRTFSHGKLSLPSSEGTSSLNFNKSSIFSRIGPLIPPTLSEKSFYLPSVLSFLLTNGSTSLKGRQSISPRFSEPTIWLRLIPNKYKTLAMYFNSPSEFQNTQRQSNHMETGSLPSERPFKRLYSPCPGDLENTLHTKHICLDSLPPYNLPSMNGSLTSTKQSNSEW